MHNIVSSIKAIVTVDRGTTLSLSKVYINALHST